MVNRGAGCMADPSLPTETWGGPRAKAFVDLTLETYGWVCWLCGLPITTRATATTDHVIPRSKGGAVYDLRNAGPAHRACNYSRGNRDTNGPASLIENGMAYFTTTTTGATA